MGRAKKEMETRLCRLLSVSIIMQLIPIDDCRGCLRGAYVFANGGGSLGRRRWRPIVDGEAARSSD